MISTLTAAQLQSLVIAYAAVATVLIPIIAGLVILVIQNIKKIQDVAARQSVHETAVNSTQESIVKLASSIIEHNTDAEK